MKQTRIEKDRFNFLQGRFQLIGTHKDGTEEILIDDPNTVVNSSFDILSDLMTNVNSNEQITSLKLGDGGVIDGVLQSPEVSDVDLGNPTFQKTGFDNIIIQNILELSITFIMNLPIDEANGVGVALYSEAGLFSTNGKMFARKTFSEQFKTDEIEYNIRWTIIFK